MAMWTLWTALLLVAAVNSELTGYPKRKFTIFNDCAKENAVSDEDLKATYNFDAIEGTAKEKCFVHCLFDNYNFLNDDGSIKPEEIEKAIKEEWPKPEDHNKILPVGEKCAKDAMGKPVGDKCEYSYKIMNCFVENIQSVKEGSTWVHY